MLLLNRMKWTHLNWPLWASSPLCLWLSGGLLESQSYWLSSFVSTLTDRRVDTTNWELDFPFCITSDCSPHARTPERKVTGQIHLLECKLDHARSVQLIRCQSTIIMVGKKLRSTEYRGICPPDDNHHWNLGSQNVFGLMHNRATYCNFTTKFVEALFSHASGRNIRSLNQLWHTDAE